VADVPIHFADPLVRRAPSLQHSADAAVPTARMNAATLAKSGIAAGDTVKVGTAQLTVQLDAGVPDNCVRVATGCAMTMGAGAMFGNVTVVKQ
jgi:NADH-quinone oxidoreductase subunit G